MRLILLALAAMMIGGCAHASRGIVIRSDYAIWLPAEPTAQERFAGEELQRYIAKMSGVKLPLRSGAEAPWPAIALVQSSRGEGESFAIARQRERIVLTGHGSRAIVYAAYALLESMGCRFLAPELEFYRGEAQFVPRVGELRVPDEALGVRGPRLAWRKIYVEEGISHTPENLPRIVDWMAKNRFNTLVVPANYQGHGRVMWDLFRAAVTPECRKRGITIEVGGHGYQNFLSAEMEEGKLFAQHPEWFGADENGQRQKGRNWVFCTSNAAAVDYVVGSFSEYVRRRPEIAVYDFWPPDGAKWCECGKCRELGTPSDRQAILLTKVKSAAAKVRPDLRLEIIAYSAALNPPAKVKLDESVLVDFCPINQQFDHAIDDSGAEKNAGYASALLAWRKAFAGPISIYSYYRKYAWDSLPVILPHYLQHDLKWYAKVPVQGVSTYAEPGDWGTYELNHWVLGKLAWDVDADVDALIRTFCAARYGARAGQAETVLLTLEDVVRQTCAVPHSTMKDRGRIEADLGRLTKMEEGAKAESGAAFARLALMCGYARRDLEVQKLRVGGADRAAVEAAAKAVRAFAVKHADDGVFLTQRLSEKGAMRRYGK